MELETIRVLGEALAIGVLLGAERYRHRDPGQKAPAGVRTFAAIGLLGGVCALIGHSAIAVATFSAVAILIAIGYYRDSVDNLGLTTEMASLLTFWLAYLVASHEAAAIAAAIMLAILLVSKRPMHDFAKNAISTNEFNDTLKFLAVVFVVYPVLPDGPVGPYGIVNPRQLWAFVVLISTINYVGYLLVRFLGTGRGLAVSALLGGIASTPAVTMSMAQRSAETPARSRLFAAAAIGGNAVQFPRLLVIVWVVSESFGTYLAAPFALMLVAGIAAALAIGGPGRDRSRDPDIEIAYRNPYSFLPALKFAIYLALVLLLTPFALEAVGQRGVYLIAALTGMGSVSAMALPLASMVSEATMPVSSATMALLIAIASNAVVKWILALINGSREMALWLGAGLALMVTTGVVYLYVVA